MYQKLSFLSRYSFWHALREAWFQDDVVSNCRFLTHLCDKILKATCICSWSLAKVVFCSSLQEPSCLHSQRGKQVYVLRIHRVWSWCRNNCSCSSEHSCMITLDPVHILPPSLAMPPLLYTFNLNFYWMLCSWLLCWVTDSPLSCDVFTSLKRFAVCIGIHFCPFFPCTCMMWTLLQLTISTSSRLL